MTRVLLFADENGKPLPSSDINAERRGRVIQCHECGELTPRDEMRRGDDDYYYCDWCYDSTGQDPGALQGIDPEN